MYAHLVRSPYLRSEIDSFRRQLDAAFPTASRAARHRRGFGDASAWLDAARDLFPRLRVDEVEHGWELVGDLPGWRPEDLRITLDAGVLTLQGERASQGEGWERVRSERPRWKFSRSVRFEPAVDADGVEARIKDGVLRMKVRRAAKPEPIAISVCG